MTHLLKQLISESQRAFHSGEETSGIITGQRLKRRYHSRNARFIVTRCSTLNLVTSKNGGILLNYYQAKKMPLTTQLGLKRMVFLSLVKTLLNY